jgi:hypothetical protein
MGVFFASHSAAFCPFYSSSSSSIRSTALFQLSCCSLLMPSRIDIAALGEPSFFRYFREDFNVIIKPLKVLPLNRGDLLQHFGGVDLQLCLSSTKRATLPEILLTEEEVTHVRSMDDCCWVIYPLMNSAGTAAWLQL